MLTKKYILSIVLIFLAASSAVLCQTDNAFSDTSTVFRSHEITQIWRGEKKDTLFPSCSLGYAKNVTIFTPDRFRKIPDEKYPLIVTFDRNGIDLTNFLLHTVDILEFAGQIPRMVVVSIESGGDPGDRTKEAKWGIDGGGAYGEKYDQFVFDELIPYMVGKYSIDRNQVIIYGHSWFGYHTAMILIQHIPDLFAVISASPCCLTGERTDDIVRSIKECGPLQHKFFLRVASGHDIGDDLDVYRQLCGKISLLRLPENFDFKSTWYSAAMHMEVPILLFIQSLYEIYADWADLAFAYADPRNTPSYNNAAIYDSLQALSDRKYGFRIPISDKHLGWRVEYYRYFKDEKITNEGRIATWKFILSKYGDDPDIFFNIANSYNFLGETDSAKVYLKKIRSSDMNDDLQKKVKELGKSLRH